MNAQEVQIARHKREADILRAVRDLPVPEAIRLLNLVAGDMQAAAAGEVEPDSDDPGQQEAEPLA